MTSVFSSPTYFQVLIGVKQVVPEATSTAFILRLISVGPMPSIVRNWIIIRCLTSSYECSLHPCQPLRVTASHRLKQRRDIKKQVSACSGLVLPSMDKLYWVSAKCLPISTCHMLDEYLLQGHESVVTFWVLLFERQ